MGCKTVNMPMAIVFLELNALEAKQPLWELIFEKHWPFHVLTITSLIISLFVLTSVQQIWLYAHDFQLNSTNSSDQTNIY